MNKFICPCGKEYLQNDEYTKWNHWCNCECGDIAIYEGHYESPPLTAFIKGYTGGYNEGLGVDIKSRDHYKEVVKKSGVIPNE